MFSMAFWILRVAPSPIDTVQITAATPMMTPSMVSAVRILLRPRARNAIRNVAVNSIQTLLWRAPRPDRGIQRKNRARGRGLLPCQTAVRDLVGRDEGSSPKFEPLSIPT